jgi:hypothetical protein
MADDFSSIPVDDLLQQLRDTPPAFVVKQQDQVTTALPPVSTEPIKEDEIGDYVIKKTTALVDQTMNAFKDIKDLAVATNDADTISALADLIKAANSAIDSLNKINIQNKKTKAAKEIAAIQAEARMKELQNQQPTTNILAVGTREEMLKIMEQAKQRTVVVEAEFSSIEPSKALVPVTEVQTVSAEKHQTATN